MSRRRIQKDCRVKRSRALRGRNPTRDNPADGPPLVHPAPGPQRAWGRVVLRHQRASELCLRKPTLLTSITGYFTTLRRVLTVSALPPKYERGV
jgi:hypothetical protein